MPKDGLCKSAGSSNPVLRIPASVSEGSECGGYLCFDLDIPGVRSVHVAVYLEPRLTSLLLELAKAYDEDRGYPEEARGWRQAADLAKKRFIARATVRSYLSQIRKCVREEVQSTSQALPIPQMFRNNRKSGVRLTFPLRVDTISEP